MRDSKKSSNINDKAELQKKFDSLDVIFQVQLKMLWDTVRCLETFFEVLGTSGQGEEDFPFMAHGKRVTRTVDMAYRFRLSPDEDQKIFLAKHMGCVRFVYNYFLLQRRAHFKATK